MKYWEIIADNLSKAGWSWGCVSAVDSNGRGARIGLAYIMVGHVRHHTGRSAGAVPGRRGKLTR
jgi:hypothetical protein